VRCDPAEPCGARHDPVCYSSESPAAANDEQRPVFNLIHASDPAESRGGQSASSHEISLLFPELDEEDTPT
jgi:hypothetical protein